MVGYKKKKNKEQRSSFSFSDSKEIINLNCSYDPLRYLFYIFTIIFWFFISQTRLLRIIL